MSKEMKKYKILFTDLDGTLIHTLSGATFPKGIWDMRIDFNVLDAIKKLNPRYVFIVSNQGGIDKGFVIFNHFLKKLHYISSCVSEYCGVETDYDYCKSNDENNPYRKPNTGMLSFLLNSKCDFGPEYAKKDMLMIGDASGLPGQFSDSDKKTAENFGIDYMDVNEFIKTYK